MPKRNYLIILCGLPASGKSTFAHKFKSILENVNDQVIVSIADPDKIRKKLYSGNFDYKKENIVRKRNLKSVRKALKDGDIVISDDLNYYSSMRHDLKEIAKKVDTPFYIIHISTPVDQCVLWNEKRGKPIPNQVVQNINQKFDLFDTYSWDKPIASINLSEITNLKAKIKNLLKIIEQDIKLTSEQYQKRSLKKKKNLYKETLDQITRKIVNQNIKNLKETSFIPKIIRLRKLFIKENLNNEMSNLDIANKFKIFLRTQLKEDKFKSSFENNFKK